MRTLSLVILFLLTAIDGTQWSAELNAAEPAKFYDPIEKQIEGLDDRR